jgi:hypothetical protein
MKSRFTRTIKWKLPRHRRSTRIFGAFEDRGRWLKCWNCGFLIDSNLGLGAGEGSGVLVTDAPTPNPSFVGQGEPLQCLLDDPFEVGLVPSSTADPADVYSLRKTEVFAGCPFCGTRNLP